MKKILLVLLTCVIVLSLVACGGSKLEKWLESDEGEDFVEEIESGLSSLADVKVTAEGGTLVIKMDINGVDDISSSQKSQLEDYYDSQEDTFKAMMGDTDDVPGLESVEFKVCEEDGDYITSVKIDV